VVPVRVPPLRERLDDIPVLAEHFLHKAHSKGLPLKQLGTEAVAALSAHHWGGNVRELENLMYRLAALCSEQIIGGLAVEDELRALAMPAAIPQAAAAPSSATRSDNLQQQVSQHLRHYFAAHSHSLPPDGLYERVLLLIEKPLIEETLRATDGNQLRAAKVLGINRNTLRKKMQQLGLLDGGRRSIFSTDQAA